MSRARLWVTRALIVVAAMAAWEVAAGWGDPLLYAPPSRVGPALGRLLALQSFAHLPSHLGVTVLEIVVAYAVAAGTGLVAGALLGLGRTLERAYAPLLAVLYAVPSVVWYPSLMLLFGLGPTSKIAFGVLLGFYPVMAAVLAGVRQVNPHLITVARAFGARPVTVFARVMLPAMLSTLVAGLRAGLALSVIGVIVGEVLGSAAGLGYLITYAYGLLRTADYLALAILILILVLALDGVAAWAERWSRRWA